MDSSVLDIGPPKSCGNRTVQPLELHLGGVCWVQDWLDESWKGNSVLLAASGGVLLRGCGWLIISWSCNHWRGLVCWEQETTLSLVGSTTTDYVGSWGNMLHSNTGRLPSLSFCYFSCFISLIPGSSFCIPIIVHLLLHRPYVFFLVATILYKNLQIYRNGFKALVFSLSGQP